MRASRIACTLLAVLALPVLLVAKGRTVKIVVTGGELAAPLEITKAGVEKFGVWEGPGTAVNGVPQTEGFICDWKLGHVGDRPEGRRVYELSFYAARDHDPPRLVYIVLYDIDPATKEGFVYLGGHALETYELNTSSIYRHGYEGKRFRATKAWDDFVRPVLEGASRRNLQVPPN
ncbi:MAG TPA: hypothetical protein VFB63_17340 [Bryobacteraceae bacterium]|nr:hypothetical protein [Bryobacteraceae bacterium]